MGVLTATKALEQFAAAAGTPAALLRRSRGRWHFVGSAGVPACDAAEIIPDSTAAPVSDSRWTGVPLDPASEFMLLVPGRREDWGALPALADLLAPLRRATRTMSGIDRRAWATLADRIAYRLTRRIAQSPDESALFGELVRAFARLAQAECAALAVFEPLDGVLRIASTVGYQQVVVDHLRIEPGEGLIGRVFATGVTFLADGVTSHLTASRPRYRTQSCMVLPITTDTHRLGVLTLADPRGADMFTAEDVAVLQRLLPIAAIALERLRSQRDREEVARLASVDIVTRLHNRHYLLGRMAAEIERVRRFDQPLAFVLFDVDDFKVVNDTWGHLEGDEVLRDVGRLLCENARLSDVCARYGGEEFALLMPGAPEDVARRVAERVRQAVEAAFAGFGAAGARMTLSAGVSALQPGDDVVRLIARSDAALLRAKGEGKNAVCVANGKTG